MILLHNPKTAGRFLTKALADRGVNPYAHGFHVKYADVAKHNPNARILTIVRNPYNRFASAVGFCYSNVFRDGKEPSVDNALDHFEKNPEFMFTKEALWFNPQSYWYGDRCEILQYESMEDWNKLHKLIGIDLNTIHIKEDYDLTDLQKSRIKRLYLPYDKLLFDLYKL